MPRGEEDGVAPARNGPGQSTPTIRARELAERLKELRLARGLTVESVAKDLLVSASKISRLENAQRRASSRDVRDLCLLYGIPHDERDRLMELATLAQEKDWYQAADIAPEYQTYVGLELAASEILNCQSNLVNGLLQTADYARALLETNRPRRDDLDSFVEAAVAVRLRRQQEVLHRPEQPARLRAVIDESALRRPIADPATMAAQIERLVDCQHLPNVTVQVIPLSRRGGHPGLDGRFSVLRFADPAIPDTVYVEGLLGELFLNGENDLVRYVEIFEYLSEHVAQSPSASLDTLHEIHQFWTTLRQ